MELAPIIVFAYNRADFLLCTLIALSKNKLASESVLYIFCDGPKRDASQNMLGKIADARKVANSQNWAKETHVVELVNNKGLGASIIDAVTQVMNIYGRAIIVEDDLVTSPAFLTYMNICLEHYEMRKSVFSVTALSRPRPEQFFPKNYPYDVYCSLKHHPWGWATWKDRWEQVDWTGQAYFTMLEDKTMRHAFMRMGEDEWNELEMQITGKINIWSARFALAHFVNHAVSIAPIEPYIMCIDNGDESTNCTGGLGRWQIDKVSQNFEPRLLDILYEDPRIINSWYSFFKKGKRSLWGKLKNWYGRKFLGRDEYALKGRVYA